MAKTRYHRALYVGRFQPFHNGHLKAIQFALNRTDELVIAIGSAQRSHEIDNPFTCGERIEMLRDALHDAGVDLQRIIIAAVPDTLESHSLWVAQVELYAPSFDAVFTNEPLTKRLCVEAGYKVEPIPFFRRELYWATVFRQRVLERKAWDSIVPPSVASWLKNHHGEERITDITQNDIPRKHKH